MEGVVELVNVTEQASAASKGVTKRRNQEEEEER